MFYVAKAKRQLQMFYVALEKRSYRSPTSICGEMKEVKASGGCHGIGKECFVQAQSRFRTQLCRGIID